jgi:type IV pilus assembly protein PilP
MIYKLKIIFLTLVFGLIFLFFACDDKSQLEKKSAAQTVSGKISQPVTKNKLITHTEKKSLNTKKESNIKEKIATSVKAVEQKPVKKESEHYNFQGKIDPFMPLIQEKSQEIKPVVDNKPKRILTPLEKIELSQIRLVAVIIMKNKQIAMVEEASGKGYEVGIGTYIGKNQGRISEIRKSSIVVKEITRDFKGRLKEHVQEIKLHKMDGEG